MFKSTIKIFITFIFLSLALLIMPDPSISKDDMTKEDYIKGIKELRKQLEEEPESPVLHNTLGFYLYKAGEYETAREEYQNAIKYNEDFSLAYNNLGILALYYKEYGKAETYFSSAIEKDPKYAKAVYNLGVTYFKQKKYVKALQFYMKAKDVDADYVKERESSDKRSDELKRALKEDPDNKMLQRLVERTKVDEAEKRLEEKNDQ